MKTPETAHELAFRVEGLESGRPGLFVAFSPSNLGVSGGMKVHNSALLPEVREFLVLDVLRPSDMMPAMLLAGASTADFAKGDLGFVRLGKADGTLLLQTTDNWVLAGRGIVLSGRAQGIISQGDHLILRNTAGNLWIPCRCLCIERFRGSGRPTEPQERGAAILVSIGDERFRALIEAGDTRAFNQLVGDYPSLHKTGGTGAFSGNQQFS